jgi:hypothetical protein
MIVRKKTLKLIKDAEEAHGQKVIVDKLLYNFIRITVLGEYIFFKLIKNK